MDNAWIGVVGTLGGTVLGALASYGNQWFAFKRDTKARERAAAMEIATQLRRWLVETASSLEAQEIREEVDNPSGNPENVERAVVPALPFENNYSTVAMLPSFVSRDVYLLIENMLEAGQKSELNFLCEGRGGEVERYHARMSKVIVDGAALYERLTEVAGWAGYAFTREEIQKWNTRTDEFDSKRKQGGYLSWVLFSLLRRLGR